MGSLQQQNLKLQEENNQLEILILQGKIILFQNNHNEILQTFKQNGPNQISLSNPNLENDSRQPENI
jgi:hypothetical protein